MSSLFQFVRSHRVIILSLFIVLVSVTYYSSTRTTLSKFETVTVKKGNVVQEVSVTGRVSSDKEVALAFEKSGRVSPEPRAVGDHVKRGDTLVRIDAGELNASRAQAKANLDYETARLAELYVGVKPEEIAIARAEVGSANIASQKAFENVVDKTHGAYAIADDAVHANTDVLWRNPRTANPEFVIQLSDAKLLAELVSLRIAIEQDLNDLRTISDRTASDNDGASGNLDEAYRKLSSVKIYLDKLANAVNGLTPNSSATSQTTIDGYRVAVANARTNVIAGRTTLLSANQSFNESISMLAVAQNKLQLKESGPTSESILSQRAKIASTEAAIDNLDAQIAKTAILAPFSGVVTRVDAKLGQTVAPNAPIVTLMSDGKWKIEANVPEVDVAKVKLGDAARMTLDAYGADAAFPAVVSEIDPAETVIDGVSTYKITLHLVSEDARVRSGMTANIDIATALRTDVLTIPTRAISSKDGLKYVRMPSADGLSTTDVPVTLGLRGSDGMTEIIDGLREGDEVVTFETK